MNPLLFADWGRMNRLFIKLMWTVAAVMACLVFAVVVSAAHPVSSPHASGAAAGARRVSGASGGAARTTYMGSTR